METIDKYIRMERDPFYLVGEKKGEARGEKKGEARTQEHVIKNLILEFGFTDEQAAKAAEASIDLVKKIRASLTIKKD